MPVTYAQVIAGARIIVNDSDPISPRHSDPQLLEFVKQGILEMVSMRYDLFTVTGSFTTTANAIEQVVPEARVLYLIDIYSVTNAGVVTAIEECDLETLRRFQPGWRSDAAATAENWMRYPAEQAKANPSEYMLYPKSPAGQTVTGKWVEIPDQSWRTVSNDLPVSDDCQPALEQYVVYRCECPNDESVMNGRAKEAYANFRVILGLGEAESDQK